jgi:cyclic-di-GMP-binding protein
MPSFDIVSKIDTQTLDNAVNVTKKEIQNRFDFKDSPVSIELNKKDMKIDLEAASDMSKDPFPSGKVTKKEVPVRNGLKQEDAKKIVKLIKDSGMKVQAAIMDDLVRVTGKKLDELQAVIQLCKTSSLGIPLQFDNMRS